nr:MAG TPA: helix-turn-helix domain protein [Caudoviricetes sp.]
MTRYYRGHTIEECLNLIPLKDKRNKLPHNAILYEYQGEIYSIARLSKQLNIPKHKLYYDVKKGILPKGVIKYNE